ncbi:MAG: SMC family ATPase, partial [Acidobacteria bacterium]|nr:SMC family ATPase [Acidobacteriota bacterium]
AHLGVEAGTDLETLFRRAIGVPQGTFTAIFLETPAERKKAFDKLLKVEEYRQGAEKLRETARYLENQINAVNIRIGRAEGELARFDDIETEHKTHAAQALELSTTAEKLNKDVAEKSEIVKKFDEAESKVNEIKTLSDKLKTENAKAEIIAKQKEGERNQAFEAQGKIKLVEEDYKTHIAAMARLKELERERIERDKLNAEMARVEKAQVKVKADRKKFQEDLEKSLRARQEISALEPKVKEQERFEKERETLRNQLADAKAAERQLETLNLEIVEQLKRYEQTKEEIVKVEQKTVSAAEVQTLSLRERQITNDLAQLRANLERDKKFQSEIQNGLCPILSQKCLNLKDGQTLETFVQSQFSEIKTQISTFEIEQRKTSDSLKQAREAEKSVAVLEKLKEHKIAVVDEGKRLRERQTALQKQSEGLSKTENDLAEIESKLKILDNPKGKIQMLQTEASREMSNRQKITEVEKNLERLESERRILVEQLESYQFLDAQWKQFSDERDRTSNAHRKFLINELLAKLLPQRETELETAKNELARLQQETAKAENDLAAASKDYDQTKHFSEKGALLEAEKRLTETQANLEYTKRRADELERELNRLTEIRRAMQSEFQEKERLEKVSEATKFIRDTLKKAAPRVARNYVHHVSLEANRMFREISGNAERTLEWTEDYGISLEGYGPKRPFITLSGGEQMAAALSVRLALLKQLSDVRLAFFDEPTTNMDAARRERLAEQISRITEKQ